MSDQDRGAYTPQHDTPLSFDARYSRGSGERPVPMTLIVSGIVLVVMVVLFALLYRSGARHSGQAPQVVGTPVTDTKAPPSAGADTPDAAAGLQVYKTEGTPPNEMKTPATLAPPPEQPAPRPAPTKPVVQADLRPTSPEAIPAQPALAKPAAKPAAKLAKAPQTIQAAVDQSTAESGSVAQIGAFSSQALAEKGWNDVAALQPGKMAGKTKKVEVASRDGKTFYRAFVGGFASRADASAFCASLVAAGKGCIVK